MFLRMWTETNLCVMPSPITLSSGKSGGDPLVSKSEMKNEMRSMIQELLEMGMIGPRVAPEL